MLSGRNEASPEACSPDAVNGYASENDVFSLCTACQSSRKTAQCCLEKLCVRAIEWQATINYLPERFQANHEKLYESEKRTELIQTTITIIRFANSKIVEHWNETDILDLLQQVGVVPVSGQAGS